jgi:hypothetical protein
VSRPGGPHGSRRGLPSAGAPHLAPGRPRPGGPKDDSPRRKPWVDVGSGSPAPAGRQIPIPPESCAPPGLAPFHASTHGLRRGLSSAGAPHLVPAQSTPHDSARARPRPGGPKDDSPRREPWVDVGSGSPAPAGRQIPLPPESCAPPGLVPFRASTHGLRRGLSSAGAPHLAPGHERHTHQRFFSHLQFTCHRGFTSCGESRRNQPRPISPHVAWHGPIPSS